MSNIKAQPGYSNHDTPEIPPAISPPSLKRGLSTGGFTLAPTGFAAKPLPIYPWHEEVGAALYHRYQLLGFSHNIWSNDWALLRRTCKNLHPAQITVKQMEDTIMAATRAGARVTYVVRYKSIWKNLRYLGIVPTDHRPDEQLPKIRKPKAVPKPLTKAEAEHFMAHGRGEISEWAVLGCLAGLRAMEASAICGSWLEETVDGKNLIIVGKTGTHAIPAHPRVVEVIESHRTFGRLYRAGASQLSERANAEMRRLGINKTFHSCRHFFATYLLQQSGDILLVAELLRHSNLNTTRGYAQLAQGRKRIVLDSLFTRSVSDVVA